VYRAKIEAMLLHWDELPNVGSKVKRSVVFLEPAISDDGAS